MVAPRTGNNDAENCNSRYTHHNSIIARFHPPPEQKSIQYIRVYPRIYLEVGGIMAEKPQINLKLLSEDERSLVERGKKRAEDLRLTFKDFLLNCLRQALVEYDARNEPATKGDILKLNDKMAVLEDKVNHPAVGRGELLAVHDRLNQLRSGFLNELRKDREQVAALKEAIARLSECVSQLMSGEELLSEVDGSNDGDIFSWDSEVDEGAE